MPTQVAIADCNSTSVKYDVEYNDAIIAAIIIV